MYCPIASWRVSLTIPRALKHELDLNARHGMTETGEIEHIPGRGAGFFQAWTDTNNDWSLSNYGPHIILRPDASADNNSTSQTHSAALAPKPDESVHVMARRCPHRELLGEDY